MSSGIYKRATKKHAVRVEHTDGSVREGFVPVPLGMDFVGVLMQAQAFMPFETDEGEQTFLNVAAIKQIASTQPEEETREETGSNAEKARRERQEEADRKRQAEQEEADRERERETTRKKPEPGKRYWTAEEYDALEILGLKSDAERGDIQGAYRKLVKLYHPDRLRGLGVSPKKIEFAAQRLSEINSAYRTLMASESLAA